MSGRVHLNRPMVLETRERVGDGAGGFDETWVALGTVWVALRARTGRDASGEGGAISATGYKITLRAAPQGSARRPVPGQRFREGNRVFAITAVADDDARARYLTCFADEEVAL